jgi:hypothetical protein
MERPNSSRKRPVTAHTSDQSPIKWSRSSGSKTARPISKVSPVQRNLQQAIEHAINVENGTDKSTTAHFDSIANNATPRKAMSARSSRTFITLDENMSTPRIQSARKKPSTAPSSARLKPPKESNENQQEPDDDRSKSMTSRTQQSTYRSYEDIIPRLYINNTPSMDELLQFQEIDTSRSELGTIDLQVPFRKQLSERSVDENFSEYLDTRTHYMSPITHSVNLVFGNWTNALEEDKELEENEKEYSAQEIIIQRNRERQLEEYHRASTFKPRTPKDGKPQITLFENHMISISEDLQHIYEGRESPSKISVSSPTGVKKSEQYDEEMDTLIKQYEKDRKTFRQRYKRLRPEKENDDDNVEEKTNPDNDNEKKKSSMMRFSARLKRKTLEDYVQELRTTPWKHEEFSKRVSEVKLNDKLAKKNQTDHVQKHVELFSNGIEEEGKHFFSPNEQQTRKSTAIETQKQKHRDVYARREQVDEERTNLLLEKYHRNEDRHQRALLEREQRPFRELMAKRCKSWLPAIKLAIFISRVEKIMLESRAVRYGIERGQLAMQVLSAHMIPLIRRRRRKKIHAAQQLILRNLFSWFVSTRIKLKRRAVDVVAKYIRDVEESNVAINRVTYYLKQGKCS